MGGVMDIKMNLKKQKYHIERMLEARLVSSGRIETRITQMELEFPHHNFQRYRERLREYTMIYPTKSIIPILRTHRWDDTNKRWIIKE